VPKKELSLDELSAATGITARNVRAYQTKGLIPPPARSGRRSVYGEEHLHRLQAIERARKQGASLSLIATHLSAGRSLDDGTLVDWGGGDHDPAPEDPARAAATDLTLVLARLDIQRDAAAQEHVEELVAAGVFRSEEGRVFTGRELAQVLTDLQRQGLPLRVALGVAQRVLRMTTPVAAAIHESVRALEASNVTHGQLGTVACYMLRHLITHHVPDAAGRRPPMPEPDGGTV
jgi:DNA-binding transcriptional MerR regulator